MWRNAGTEPNGLEEGRMMESVGNGENDEMSSVVDMTVVVDCFVWS